jgi:threonine/homoserine/homoserine lactone efflux protein
MSGQLNLASLALFAFVSSITPGPNNLLLMRSGARFGVGPTAPHVIGIEAGMVGLLLLAHLGVGAMLLALPGAFGVLRWACFVYLTWLAWQVLRDTGNGATKQNADGARPMSVHGGALFQLVNPKAWMMAITGSSAFSTAGTLTAGGLATVIGIFIAIGTPCMFVWALWGAGIHRLLRRPAARRAFNVAMAAVVMATAVLMLRKEGA